MSISSNEDETPFVSGIVAGIAAWLVGYVLTYVVTAGSIRNTLLGQLLQSSDAGSVPQAVGLVFYNAHFVETVVDAGFLGSSSVSLIGGDGGFTPLLYAVPVVLLALAGVGVAFRSDARDPAVGAKAGVTAVIGYLPLSVIGIFLVGIGSDAPSAAPDLLTGVLLAGVIYPVAFGAVGGVIGSSLADE